MSLPVYDNFSDFDFIEDSLFLWYEYMFKNFILGFVDVFVMSSCVYRALLS